MEINDKLKNEKVRFILVKAKDKIPLELDWQNTNNYAYNDPKLLDHLKSGGNYGVLTGNGLVVIDTDTQEAVDMVKKKLPSTFTVQTGSGYMHYYYYTDLNKKMVLKDKDKHLGEVQALGQFVVGEGCIHPNGNKYELYKDQEIETISKDEIKRVFNGLSSGTSINLKDLELSPAEEGNRNETCFNLARKYKKKKLNPKETFALLLGWNKTNKPPMSEQEIKRTVESCFRDYEEIEKKEKEKANRKFVLSTLGVLRIDNYINNAKKFWEIQPFFFDKSLMFWFWSEYECKWGMVDEIDLMNALDKKLGFEGQTVTSKIKSNYLEAFKRVGRINHPKDAPKTWIQFKGKIFDFKTKEIFDATPEHFVCNPIPWDLGETSETPVINRLFKEWVGEKYIKTLYEIIAYCCIIDYPIHLAFCLIGSGRNGKTKFQQLIAKFIGMENISSTELDTLLDSRFESAKLYKKLVCLLGETNFGIIKKTSLLKKLTGQDLIGFEFKRKKPFDDYNYAKVLINSNSLPSSDDTSEGFYRRWLIIDFPNQFKEGKDILEIIPEEEYNNLTRKVTEIIPQLLERGEFTNQGSIEERRKRYIMASNPLPFFIEHACYVNSNNYTLSSELYKNYVSFLLKMKRRVVSKKEFSEALLREGFESRRTTHNIDETYVSSYYIEGLSLKKDWDKEVMSFMSFMHDFTTNPRIREFSSDSLHKLHNLHNSDEKRDKKVIKQIKIEKIDVSDEKPPKSSSNDKIVKKTPKTEKTSKKTEIPGKIIEQLDWLGTWFPKEDPEAEVELVEMYQKGVTEAQIKEKLAIGTLYECRPGFIRRLC